MSTSRSPVTIDDTLTCFPSLAALKAAHIALLERRRLHDDIPAFVAEIAAFVQRGSATGVLLHADDDRWTSQSMLDYWSNLLYRLGYEPPDATLAAFDPVLAPEIADVLCPYLGLDAFRETHQARFFGRQRLITELVARLSTSRFLAVVGPSGSGKSSLVLGGLLPALKTGALPNSQDWQYYPPLVPGSDPLANLARLTQPAGSNRAAWAQRQIGRLQEDPSHLTCLLDKAKSSSVVLVVDQFEEIFTLCDDDRVRQAFIDNLLGLVQMPGSRHSVILTMRSDFESYVARLPNLQPLFGQAQLRVMPLNANELREAIEQPAERVGLKFEDGIVEALVKEILGEPAGLPLLQFTLLKLWENREHNRVTWDAYYHLGGARLALARSADAWYEALIPEEQVTAKRLLLRMVRPGEGLEVTSNRVRRETLYRAGEAPDRIDRVLDKLVDARLVRLTAGDTPSDTQVEVAHEALVRNWPKLVAWLEDQRVVMRRRLHLAAAVQQWEALGRDPGTLLRGALLDEARHYEDLNEQEMTFVQVSLAAVEEAEREQEAARLRELAQIKALAEAERQRAVERRRAEEQARTTRRTQLFAVILLVVVLAVVAVVFAFEQAIIATRTAAEAQMLALSSSSQVALSQGDTDLAVALALAANRVDQPANQVQLSLHAQFALAEAAYAPGTRRVFTGHSATVRSVALSANGRTALSGSEDKTLMLWDVVTGKPLHRFVGHAGEVHSVVFSPDGRTALSGSEDQTLILWDLSTGQIIRHFVGHAGEVHSVAFSPDGRTALSGSEDQTLILWDLATATVIRRFMGHTEAVTAVAFSPDGRTVLSGAGNTLSPSTSGDTRLILWDVATGQPIRYFVGHTQTVWAVAFSPDGQRRVLSGAADTNLILWDLDNGTEIRRFHGHTEEVLSVAFSPDGRTILSGSRDARLGLWDVKTGERIRFLVGHGASVRAAVFGRDGRTALSGSLDTSLRLWDLTNSAELRRFEEHTDRVTAVAFSPDGRTALSGSGSIDKTLILWNLDTGQVIHRFEGHTRGVFGVAFSPDGRTALSGSEDKTLILWDLTTGQIIRRFEGHTDGVSEVVFSPDGRTALSSSVDRTLILWDVATGQSIRSFVGHIDKVLSVAFGPDGRTALSGSEDQTMILWDIATGQPIRRFEGHSGAVRDVAFNPDGHTALSGSVDTTMRLWRIDSRDELIGWTITHRHMPELTCQEPAIYRLDPRCDESSPSPKPAS